MLTSGTLPGSALPQGAADDSTRWERVQDLFHQASDLAQEHRAGFLSRACGDDLALYSEVQLLLKSSLDEVSLAAAIQEESSLIFDYLPGLHRNDRIGPYSVGDLIGRGGMGNVYAGSREDGQYEQRVAIKVVRPEIFDANQLLRFRREQQILANLDHPNIARLLDGGMTQTGLPYLIVEYVDGKPIDEYCRDAELSIEKRLQLFRTVCSAVQYAHNRLVIHRDLKPSNLLVTETGNAKLLDFGIAGLMSGGGDGAQSQPVTLLAERPMTLEYASPEQLRGEATTTATDVFALGTLLYELLSGKRPQETSGTHLVEAQRRICEVDPPPPSFHNPLISRELDDIVRMAIRKEPEARYVSVDNLSADIQSYLDGFPVAATKGDRRYRAFKFIRRHPAGIGLAATALLLIICFAAVAAVLAERYARERDVANTQTARAEQVAQVLTNLFSSSDPFEAKGQVLTARQLLDTGFQRVEKELKTQPAVRAKVLETIGIAYQHLGIYTRAAEMFRGEIRDSRAAYGANAAETGRALRYLGDVERQLSDLPAAERDLRASLAILDRQPGNSTEKSNILNDLGLVSQEGGKPADAEPLYLRAIQLSGLDPQNTAETLVMKSNLGSDRGEMARYAEAEPLMREVLSERRRLLGESHPQVATSMARLAFLLELGGSYGESEQLQRQAIAHFEHDMGPQSFDVLANSGNLAVLLDETGRAEEAESLLRRNIQAGSATLPPGHAFLTIWKANLARILMRGGRSKEADGLLRESALKAQSTKGVGGRFAPQILSAYGRLLVLEGDNAEAELVLRQSLAVRRQRSGDEHPATADADSDLGGLLAKQGRCEEATTLFDKALAIDTKRLKPHHLHTAAHLLEYAEALNRCGQPAHALSLAKEALASRSSHMGPNVWPVMEAREALETISAAAR